MSARSMPPEAACRLLWAKFTANSFRLHAIQAPRRPLVPGQRFLFNSCASSPQASTFCMLCFLRAPVANLLQHSLHCGTPRTLTLFTHLSACATFSPMSTTPLRSGGPSARIAVIPGDGIGKEVTPVGLAAIKAATAKRHRPIEFVEFDWSADKYLREKISLPEGAVEILQNEFDAIL